MMSYGPTAGPYIYIVGVDISLYTGYWLTQFDVVNNNLMSFQNTI